MIYLRKKQLSRRTFLRGAGVCMALPLLESMAKANTTNGKAPQTRLGFYFVPHGAVMDRWTPSSVGALELSSTLSPLQPFRNHLNVVSDLALPLAYTEDASAAANHCSSSAVFLSGARMHKNTNLLGVTVDQVAVRHLGQDSPLPSLELGIEDSSNACGEGWSCAYRDTISWLDERTPLPVERNPQVVFERLFGTGATAEARSRNRAESQSILDAVREQSTTLERTLPVADRRRMDQYLTDVREIERRVQLSSQTSGADLKLPPKPIGIPTDFEDHLKAMFDLQVLAWQTGMTRISSLMLAVEASNAVYPRSGVKDAFHPLSHHSNIQANKDRLAQLNRYHIGLFGYLLGKMQGTPDGEGTLLDHSILLWGSGMSDSNVHNHDPLPILLAGGGAGRLQGGRHIRAGEGRKVPLANLHVALLRKAGVEVDKLGDSTGIVDI
jgi:uncharacterized protein DUF1552